MYFVCFSSISWALQAVAKAFDCEVEHHKVLVDMCRSWFKKDNLDDPCFKLALIPSQAKLNFGLDKVTGKRMLYPLVSVENVFIFPGTWTMLLFYFSSCFHSRNSWALETCLHQSWRGVVHIRVQVLLSRILFLQRRDITDRSAQSTSFGSSSSHLWFLSNLDTSVLQNQGSIRVL